MNAATLFDGLLFITAICGPFFILALIAEAWEAFSDMD